MQGRRLASPEAKAAIEESVRRVRSIALVHEILSREAGEDVPFLAIVHDLTTAGRAEATIASTSARSCATTIRPFITTQWPGKVQTNG